MLEACVATADAVAMLTWVDPAFLRERGVEIESAFPLWGGPEEFEMMRAEPAKSIDAGLSFRSLEETIRDSRAWDQQRGLPVMEGSIAADREAELLSTWNARG
jgi:2'-hydroxyisoflavone reductase